MAKQQLSICQADDQLLLAWQAKLDNTPEVANFREAIDPTRWTFAASIVRLNAARCASDVRQAKSCYDRVHCSVLGCQK